MAGLREDPVGANRRDSGATTGPVLRPVTERSYVIGRNTLMASADADVIRRRLVCLHQDRTTGPPPGDRSRASWTASRSCITQETGAVAGASSRAVPARTPGSSPSGAPPSSPPGLASTARLPIAPSLPTRAGGSPL